MERLERLNKMLEDDPNDSFVLFAIAMEYKTNEHYENAIVHFEKLKIADPKYVGLYYHLGECYVEIDENEKAMDVYKNGISIAEDLKDLHAKSELMNVKVNLDMGL